MEKAHVLYIDEGEWVPFVEQLLKAEGIEAKRPLSRKELDTFLEEAFPVIVVDPRAFGSRGLELLHLLKEKLPKADLVVLTDPGDEEKGIEALKEGASDWITKRREDLFKLPWVVKRILKEKERVSELEALLEEVLAASQAALIVHDTKEVLEQKGLERLTNQRLLSVSSPEDLLQVVAPEARGALLQRFREERENKDLFPSDHVFALVPEVGKRTIALRNKLAWWKERPVWVDVFLDVTSPYEISERQRQIALKYQALLHQVVSSLSHAIEIKDPYTAGHQRRVAQLAEAIAREMGLDDDFIEGLRLSALLHDIGKSLGVPVEILTKPTALTNWEWEIIKQHPKLGYEILKDIRFLWPVAEAVLQHHERWDGSGYPQGLRDDEIILEARILGVADVVEAMASHRPYRPALGLEEALREIEGGAGRLYDPQVSKGCLAVFEKGFKFDL